MPATYDIYGSSSNLLNALNKVEGLQVSSYISAFLLFGGFTLCLASFYKFLSGCSSNKKLVPTNKAVLFPRPGKFVTNLVSADAKACASDSFLSIQPVRSEIEAGIHLGWGFDGTNPVINGDSNSMMLNGGINPQMLSKQPSFGVMPSNYALPTNGMANNSAYSSEMDTKDTADMNDFFEILDLPIDLTSNLRMANTMGPRRSHPGHRAYSLGSMSSREVYMGQRRTMHSVAPASPPDFSPPKRFQQLSMPFGDFQESSEVNTGLRSDGMVGRKPSQMRHLSADGEGYSTSHNSDHTDSTGFEYSHPRSLASNFQPAEVSYSQYPSQHNSGHFGSDIMMPPQVSVVEDDFREDDVQRMAPPQLHASSSRASSFSDVERELEFRESSHSFDELSPASYNYSASTNPSSKGSPFSALNTPVSVNGGSSKGTEEFKCNICDATFRIKGYLTRHVKKHADVKAYQCPFFHEHDSRKCHPTGGFSRRDTYKTHLKSRHFLYPNKVRSAERAHVAGHCSGCLQKFENSEVWIESHIQKNECPNLEMKVGNQVPMEYVHNVHSHQQQRAHGHPQGIVSC